MINMKQKQQLKKWLCVEILSRVRRKDVKLEKLKHTQQTHFTNYPETLQEKLKRDLSKIIKMGMLEEQVKEERDWLERSSLERIRVLLTSRVQC